MLKFGRDGRSRFFKDHHGVVHETNSVGTPEAMMVCERNDVDITICMNINERDELLKPHMGPVTCFRCLTKIRGDDLYA